MWVFGLKMRVGGSSCGVWIRWGRKKVRKSEKNGEKMRRGRDSSLVTRDPGAEDGGRRQ